MAELAPTTSHTEMEAAIADTKHPTSIPVPLGKLANSPSKARVPLADADSLSNIAQPNISDDKENATSAIPAPARKMVRKVVTKAPAAVTRTSSTVSRASSNSSSYERPWATGSRIGTQAKSTSNPKPSSQNVQRPSSAAGPRPSSATGTRPSSATGIRSASATGTRALSASSSAQQKQIGSRVMSRPGSAQDAYGVRGSSTMSKPGGIPSSRSGRNLVSLAGKTAGMDSHSASKDLEEAYKMMVEQLHKLKEEREDWAQGKKEEVEYLKQLLETERSRVSSLESAKTDLIEAKAEAEAASLFHKRQIIDAENSFNDERSRLRLEHEQAVREHNDQIKQIEQELQAAAESLLAEKLEELANSKDAEIRGLEEQIQIAQSTLTDKLKELGQQKDAELQEARKMLEEAVARHETAQEELCAKYDAEISRLNAQAQLAQQELKQQLVALEEQKNAELAKLESFKADMEDELLAKIRSIERIRTSLEHSVQGLEGDLTREKAMVETLKNNITEQNMTHMKMESSAKASLLKMDEFEATISDLTRQLRQKEQELADSQGAQEEMSAKLREEETIRRKLHNTIQELKGNIRVFCRVRPQLAGESGAELKFPDRGQQESREIEVHNAGTDLSLGSTGPKTYPFKFDRVFGPDVGNKQVFDEISQLVQSALDGYNVCIFAYGQTGSGKTHTMSSDDGMIPSAVNQIYEAVKALEPRGWAYTMEGQFLEIYNETINDLIGNPEEFDKTRHEIHHEKDGTTTVSGLSRANLDTPQRVIALLRKAARSRSVAATKANERSSRSHSVFILHLQGFNKLTNERSNGVLNLIDLAGSERLSHSQATGERLKETQSINKSLACLGDVIAALGNAKEGAHVPYRNSKLTYLLQNSLGGNSKTLMFVNVSPAQDSLNETLCSLRFATKVNNTQIGSARRIVKA